jgi:tartrate dehydratase alpha subunit/fumarate hydratase class I-like protein
MKQTELYQAIADKVLEMMDKLGADWLRPLVIALRITADATMW